MQYKLKINHSIKATKSGFTFLEIMIVIIIMASLAAIVGQNLFSRVDEANQKKASIEMKNIASALDFYYLDNQSYPTSDEGLKALIEKPREDFPTWNGPYLKAKTVPLDPWAHPYQYELSDDASAYTITSLGSDHKEGGTGVKKDIIFKNSAR